MPLAKRVGLDKVRSIAVESLIISSNSTRVTILNFNTLAYQFFGVLPASVRAAAV